MGLALNTGPSFEKSLEDREPERNGGLNLNDGTEQLKSAQCVSHG